jgi:hypothetical protein
MYKLAKLFPLLAVVLASCKSEQASKSLIPSWFLNNDTDIVVDNSVSAVDRIVLESIDVFPDCRITMLAVGLSWSSAVRDICSQCDLSVMIPKEFEGETCDVNFSNVLIKDALTQLCAGNNKVSFNIVDNMVVFDSAVVQSVGIAENGYATPDELASAINNILPDGTSVLVANGKVVVGGTNSVVDQASAIAQLVGSHKPSSWYVDVCILSMADNWATNFGITGSIGGIVNFNADGDPNILESVLNGSWNIQSGGGIDSVVLRTSVILLSGTKSFVRSVEEIPVPRTTVSPQGTVTVSGYDTVNAGITLSLDCIAVDNGLRVAINPEVSDIQGYVGDRPLITRREVSSNVIIKDGDVVLLSGLWSNRTSNQFNLPLDISKSDSLNEWIVCCRFKKIG